MVDEKQPGSDAPGNLRRTIILRMLVIAIGPLFLTGIVSYLTGLPVTIIVVAILPVVIWGSLWVAIRIIRDEVNEKTRELDAIRNYKSEFLANMSHELRTPLNCILILSELLGKSDKLTEKEQEFVKTINESGSELITLIDDILDLSKLHAGRMDIHEEILYLPGFMDTVRRVFKPVAAQKGLDFSVTADAENLPEHIRTDPYRLRQVLNNLLSNALKFTESGRVTLSVGRPAKDADLSNGKLRGGGAIAITVTDTGIGIPEEKHEVVFESFKQNDGAVSRKYGGTGLGLSISKELVQLMGGEIHLHSEPGKGSTFTLYLPEKAGEPEPVTHEITAPDNGVPPLLEPKEKPSPPAGLPPGKKILVVDDDMRSLFATTSRLEEKGLSVIMASGGKKALEKLDLEPGIDLVVMDLIMPDMDGCDTIRKIRERESPGDRERAGDRGEGLGVGENLGIIVFTARARREDRDRCMAAGADDYFIKPVADETLCALLQKWLGAPSPKKISG